MFKNFNRDDFRVMFRAVFTILVSLWTGAYLWSVTFSKAEEVSKYAEFIIGFVLGTLIATLINFYFGGTENDQKQVRSPTGRSGDDPDPDSLPDEGPEVISGDDT